MTVNPEDQGQDLVQKALLNLVPPEFRDAPEIKFTILRQGRLAKLAIDKALAQLQLNKATLEEATLLADELESEEPSPAPRGEVAHAITTRRDGYSAALTLVLHHQPVPPWFKLEHDCSECGQKSNPVWTTYCRRIDFDAVSIEDALNHILCEGCGVKARQKCTPKIVKFEGWFLRMVILRLRKEGLRELANKVFELASNQPLSRKANPPQNQPQPTVATQPLRVPLGAQVATKGPKKTRGQQTPQATPLPNQDEVVVELQLEDVVIIGEETMAGANAAPAPADPMPIRGHKEGIIRFKKRLDAWEARQPKTTG